MEKSKYYAPECEEVMIRVETEIIMTSTEDMGEEDL